MRPGLPLLLVVGLLVSALPDQASRPSDWPQGLFGNVEYSELSGDLGGFEVRFYTAHGHHMVEFVDCEGWCNEAYRSQVRRESSGFVFEHVEQLTTSQGGIENHRVRYKLTPRGKGFRVESWYDGEKIAWPDTVLRPLKRPYGLKVAKAAGAN